MIGQNQGLNLDNDRPISGRNSVRTQLVQTTRQAVSKTMLVVLFPLPSPALVDFGSTLCLQCRIQHPGRPKASFDCPCSRSHFSVGMCSSLDKLFTPAC